MKVYILSAYIAAIFLVAHTVVVPTASATSVKQITVSNDPTVCPNAQYSTIQAAINDAPPGAIILVCTGIYPEQLSINEPLTITGQNGVSVQPSNIAANSTGTVSGQPIAAVILVQNATNVYLNQIVVDGANTGITQCAPDLVGIFYRNASGEISQVTVRGVKLTASLDGCQSGSGILVQSGGGLVSEVDIEGSSIHDYQKNGITANEAGTHVKIKRNTVTGVGATAGAAQNGIQIGFGATGKIDHNTVANNIWSPCLSTTNCTTNASDILVYQSDGVTVDQNRAGVSQTGIAIVANHACVTNNHVYDTQIFDGIQLIGNDNETQENEIVHSDQAGVFIQGHNNLISQNRINEAAFGVLEISGSNGNIIAANYFANATIKVKDPTGMRVTGSPYR